MIDASIAAAYDARAAEYIELAGSIDQMDTRDRDLIARWRDATSGMLLDAGCGPGHWTEFLHDRHRAVLGLDISGEFIAAAKARYAHLTFQPASFRDLPVPDASAGGILAWYSLIHTPPAELSAIFAEFARALAQDGSLLIGYFDGPPRESFAHAVAPAFFWSADALEELLEPAGFAITQREHRLRQPGEVSRRPHGALAAIRR